MQGFTTLRSKCIPLNMDNVDTDQIIPARYLLMITKDGYGDHLFQDWRFNEDGSEKPEFVLNKKEHKGAEVLIAGENFGSGSSREHAVWAISQYGIKCVIAPSYSDIFTNNAYGNGLLVIRLERDVINSIFERVESNFNFEIGVDLPNQKVIVDEKHIYDFQIDPFVKEKLIKGLDNIGYILDKDDLIRKFEADNNVVR